MAKPEEILAQQVTARLNIANILFFHPANEGKRGWGAIRSFHRNGGKAGVADLVILLPFGRCVFVELKAGYNKQQPTQIAFENEVRKRGFEYYVWRSVDDANQFCNQIVREGYNGTKLAGLF